MGLPYWERKHRKGRQGLRAPAKAELWRCHPQCGCKGAHSWHRASRHFPTWSAPTPSSRLGHMKCSRSSLRARCQAAISWEQLPVCAGRAPSGPQPAPVSSVPRSRASHASRSPGWRPALPPSPCRAGELPAMPGRAGEGGEPSKADPLGAGLLSEQSRSPRPTRCGGWDSAGKGWAGRRAVLPAGCGPGLALPLAFRLGMWREEAGPACPVVGLGAGGCSAPGQCPRVLRKDLSLPGIGVATRQCGAEPGKASSLH